MLKLRCKSLLFDVSRIITRDWAFPRFHGYVLRINRGQKTYLWLKIKKINYIFSHNTYNIWKKRFINFGMICIEIYFTTKWDQTSWFYDECVFSVGFILFCVCIRWDQTVQLSSISVIDYFRNNTQTIDKNDWFEID